MPLNKAFFTEEGYLIDTPILTSTGIFEYRNADGSIRRELRLPEEVFSEDSLESYMAKPVIITHDAGLVTKDNVSDNEIGTILTKGYRDGDNVRAKIVIHDTDEMKSSGLKELSLGYNLDLDETPGTWNGQHYDAIQRNIRINHLALVREARAGEKARLNIDSRDSVSKGVKIMRYTKRKGARRSDGVLSPEELKKAIEEYKKNHPIAEKQDGEEPETKEVPVPAKAEDGEEPVAAAATEASPEQKVEAFKAARENNKDEEEEAAEETIARQDEDIQCLLDIIDSLLAERDFNAGKADCKVDGEEEDPTEVPAKEDGDDDLIPEQTENKEDGDDDPIPDTEKGDVSHAEVMNADSIDAIVRARVKIGIAADKLNLDGVESMSLSAARKAVIRAVRPTMNLDGKGDAYIKAAFDCAFDDIKKRGRKDVSYQKKQMFNGDSRNFRGSTSSAEDARQRMIERRRNNKKKEDK